MNNAAFKKKTQTHLALQKLQARTPTGTDMAQLLLRAMLGDDRGGITTTDDNDCAVLRGFDVRLEEGGGAFGEGGEFENAGGSAWGMS